MTKCKHCGEKIYCIDDGWYHRIDHIAEPESIDVKIINTKDQGCSEFAVVHAENEDEWIDAFPSIQEAQHYCVMHNLTVITCA